MSRDKVVLDNRSAQRRRPTQKTAIDAIEHAANEASQSTQQRHAHHMWVYKQDLLASESYLKNNFGKTVRVHSLGGELARHNDRCGTVVDKIKEEIVVQFHDAELPRVVQFPLENLILTSFIPPVSPLPRPKHRRSLSLDRQKKSKLSVEPKSLSSKEKNEITICTATTKKNSSKRRALHERYSSRAAAEATRAVSPRHKEDNYPPIKKVTMVSYHKILHA